MGMSFVEPHAGTPRSMRRRAELFSGESACGSTKRSVSILLVDVDSKFHQQNVFPGACPSGDRLIDPAPITAVPSCMAGSFAEAMSLRADVSLTGNRRQVRRIAVTLHRDLGKSFADTP